MPAGYVPSARPGCGFGPVPFVYVVLIEFSLVILIIGLAISLAAREYSVAAFKATFTEALLAASQARHEFAERISLTGTLEEAGDAAQKGVAQRASVDPKQSIDAAEQELKRSGATPIDARLSRTRTLRLGSSYVVLVDYRYWPGTGAASFRPAVPDVERPASVMLHCGPGSPPKGWVAPPEQVPSNLPRSHQPWMCRSRLPGSG